MKFIFLVFISFSVKAETSLGKQLQNELQYIINLNDEKKVHIPNEKLSAFQRSLNSEDYITDEISMVSAGRQKLTLDDPAQKMALELENELLKDEKETQVIKKPGMKRRRP